MALIAPKHIQPKNNLDRDKWRAQRRGADADYIPGLDDGEQPERKEPFDWDRAHPEDAPVEPDDRELQEGNNH